MRTSSTFSFAVGVIGIALGVIILVVDETKNAATYFAVGMLVVIGLGLILGVVSRRSGSPG